MALAENLQAAEAVITAMQQYRFFASNRRSDRVELAGGLDQAGQLGIGQHNSGQAGQNVGVVRGANFAPSDAVDGLGAPITNSIGQLRAITLPEVAHNYANILATHTGNCWEQAQVAFYELYSNHLAARPLDLMYFRNPTYDHVWVGIGLAPGWNTVSPIRVGGNVIGRYNLRNWGADAVWCDPWQGDGVAYSVADLIAGKVRNLNAIYKCNTAEAIEEGWPGSYLRVG